MFAVVAILWFIAAMAWAAAGNLPLAVLDIALGTIYFVLWASSH